MKSIVTIALMLFSSQTSTVRQADESLGTELHESYKAWFAALDKATAQQWTLWRWMISFWLLLPGTSCKAPSESQ